MKYTEGVKSPASVYFYEGVLLKLISLGHFLLPSFIFDIIAFVKSYPKIAQLPLRKKVDRNQLSKFLLN